jgi:SET domain-containing protein
MLKVKTEVRPSKIAGNGLFLAEFISKDTVVWEYHPAVDKIFEDSEIVRLCEAELKKLMFHAYLNNNTGKVVYCGDGASYMNHSDQPSLLLVENGKPEGACIAARDLWPGEELTCDYYDFDGVADWKLGKCEELRLKMLVCSEGSK